MNYTRILRMPVPILFLLGLCMATGCGMMVDKDRIQIARVNGQPITRGDLDKVLRLMEANERPSIRTKGDVLQALQNHIDDVVKQLEADQLLEQKKIHVDRARAEMIYRITHPQDYMQTANPEEYNMTEKDMQYMAEERELGIDHVVRKLYGEEAIRFRIREALDSGQMSVAETEYETEYALRKDELFHPERILFQGVVLPGASDDIVALATAARERIIGGETVAAVASSYTAQGARLLETELQNTGNPKYVGFWQEASGAEADAVLGPIFIRGWQMVRFSAAGEQIAEPLPDSLMVFRVMERVAPQQKTLEEAKPDLAPNLLYSKMMEELRKKNGVVVYEDKLPDPSMYDMTKSVMARQPA